MSENDNMSAEYEYEDIEYFDEESKRNKLYTELVGNIIDNNKANQTFKKVFFIIVCSIFVLLAVVGILIILNISSKDTITYTDIGVALTGLGSVLSSVIILPQIIAKHLFPENGEIARFDFVKANQHFDLHYAYGEDYDEEDTPDNSGE